MKQTLRNAGLAAATMAAAAGAYYLYGSKDAAKNRKKTAAWMRRAEREIVHEAKKLKNAAFTEDNYRKAINIVAARYSKLKDVDPDDVKRFVSAVQKSWQQAGKAVKARASSMQGAAKKKAKKIVRKAKKMA